MTDILTQEWAAPSHRLDTTPAPQPRRRRTVPILLVVSLVLTLVGFGIFAFIAHGQLTEARADNAQVSSQLASTKADLDKAHQDNAGLRTENHDLNAKVKRCAVFVPITNHMFNAMNFELKALNGGLFGSLLWLPKATAEMHTVKGLIGSHQSYDGELLDYCKATSNTNA